ncbi:MAG: preprotein translocase subunit SecE [Pirellulales bacterium]
MNTKDTTLGGRAPDPSGSRTFFEELFAASLYKRNQGRLVRQLTCLAVWVFAGAAAWRLHQQFLSVWFTSNLEAPSRVGSAPIGYLIAVAFGIVGAWIGYRLVNWAKFADFLISVEAELNKVSWPTQKELIRASMVVIFTILFMSVLLFFYDTFWRLLFTGLGIAS